jgi:hypothetical protein
MINSRTHLRRRYTSDELMDCSSIASLSRKTDEESINTCETRREKIKTVEENSKLEEEWLILHTGV